MRQIGKQLRKRWSTRRGKLLLVAATILVLVCGGAVGAAAYTQRSTYCADVCHEMQPYGATWRASAHREVACVRCHVEPGSANFLRAKATALHEVWVHVFGKPTQPLRATRHVPDDVCTSDSCHPRVAARDSLANSTVKLSHADHSSASACRDCHAYVVHDGVPGRSFVDPAAMAFCLRCHDDEAATAQCTPCHSRPHAARGRCITCHTRSSWASAFDHSSALGTAHRKVRCERCHARGSTQGTVTAVAATPAAGCVSCHRYRHAAGRLTDCAACHTMKHWTPSTYRHPASGCLGCHTRPHADRGACLSCHTTTTWASRFAHPLQLGAHTGMSCERCHTRGVSRAAVTCSACHGDHHGGLTDCRSCHTTTSWTPSTYRHPAVSPHVPEGVAPLACASCHPVTFSSATCSCHDTESGGN